MNIKKSALYLIGGLYFLFFSAACVCNPPANSGKSTAVSTQQQQTQPAVAPVEVQVGEETIVEDGAVVESTGEIVVEDGGAVVEST
ncbi:hypothetical protein VU06_04100, partial [Desulfobulbus sp. F3]|nr:hypothetical protein [Desulfobulbus sp. F3]